jgi:hypothetical protein
MVRRATDQAKAISARGGLGERDSKRGAQGTARINADGSGRCVADVRDASTLHTTVSGGIS